MSGQIGVKSFLKGIYSNNPPCGMLKNKPNSKPIHRINPLFMENRNGRAGIALDYMTGLRLE